MTSKPDRRDRLELIEWENRPHCLYLNNTRIAGGKPWGGGKIIRTWNIERSVILEALKRSSADDE